MESKIKCDRQYPCSKCATRGKDCVFTGPGRRASVVTQPTPTPETVSTYVDPSSEGTTTLSSIYMPAPQASHSYSIGSFHIQEEEEMLSASMSMPSFSDQKSFPSSPDFNTSSSMVDLYTSASDISSNHESERLMPVHSHLSSVYASDMFEPFFSTIFSQSPPTLPMTGEYDQGLGWAGIGLRDGSPEDFPFFQGTPPRSLPSSGSFDDGQAFEATPEASVFPCSPLRPALNDAQHSPIDGANVNPNGSELQHYCK